MLAKFIIAIIILLAAPSGALAVEYVEWHATQPPATQKPKFKDTHPKFYRCYRSARFACHVAEPFVSVTAKICQILLPFVI